MNLRDLNSSPPSDDASCKWCQFYLYSYSNIQHLWMTLIQLLFIYCSHLKIQLTMTLPRVKWVAIFRKRRGGAISKISLNWRQSACVELAIIKIEFAAYWPYFNGKCNQRVWRRKIKNTSERQAAHFNWQDDVVIKKGLRKLLSPAAAAFFYYCGHHHHQRQQHVW